MSRRITASVAKELITFAKSIKVRASHYDNKSTSAYEFYRQIGLSPKLKAANPDFEASFTEEINDIVDPTINCEFTDWSEWSSCENAAKKGNNIDDNVFAIRRRTRKITLTPKNGGIKCPTKLLEEENCRIMTSL